MRPLKVIGWLAAMSTSCGGIVEVVSSDGGTAGASSSSPGSSSSGSPSMGSDGAPSSDGPRTGFTCLNADGCATGEICCDDPSGMIPYTRCFAGPCPLVPPLGMPLQLCGNVLECPAGQVCGIPPNQLLQTVLPQVGTEACFAP
jgi:hypothetical protein